MTNSDIHTDDTSTLPLAPGRWTLDTAHTTVGFTIRHLGVSKVRGVFHDVTAEVVVGPTPGESTIGVRVGLASIDTGIVERDTHLRASDMLDVENRRQMDFRSTDIRGAGDRWTLDGELTIGDVTRPLSLDVEFGGLGTFPLDGSVHAGFTATGEIRRKDFGLGFGLPPGVLGDVVRIEIDLELIAPE